MMFKKNKFVHNYSEAEIFFNPQSCRRSWQEFLDTPINEMSEHSEEVIYHLNNMLQSSTKDILTTAATTMELSNLWNNSPQLREWFQTVWLPMAKVRELVVQRQI